MTTADKVLAALESFGLKSEGSGNYRCNSPLRPGANSMSFTVKVDDGEHGSFYDHKSSEKGSLYELAKALNIALPMVAPIDSTKRAYAGLMDYARAHGLTADVLQEWHWREVTHQNRPALEFSTKTGKRWRFMDGDAKKAVYISEKGYVRCWYGFNRKVKYRLDDGLPLVICNGEISTIAGQHYGLAAIAMTGGEKGEIPPDLMSELKGEINNTPKAKIIVALDCDSAGRKAAHGIVTQLKSEGFNVRAVDLGLSKGGDLADFCMLHTDGAGAALVALPDLPRDETDSGREFHFYSIDQLLKLPPLEWLIPGVLPARGIGMIYGPSGVGKSFYTLDIAFRLAFRVPVIYIVAEGETGMGERVAALLYHHKTKPDNLTFLLGAVDLFDDDDLTAFKSVAAQYQPQLIVVDTLAMCTGSADENSARDMKVIIDGCKRMAKQLSASVVLVHHTNKEGREARGSGRLFNDMDTVIRVIRQDDLIAIESRKSKDRQRFKTYYLREVNIPLGYKDHEGNDVTSLVLMPAEMVQTDSSLTELQHKILESLMIEPNASFNDLASMCEVSRSTIAGAVTRLTKAGFLTPYDGTGGRSLTERGLRAVDSPDSSDSPDSHVSDETQNEKIQELPESRESPESANHSRRQRRLIDVPVVSQNQYTDGY